MTIKQSLQNVFIISSLCFFQQAGAQEVTAPRSDFGTSFFSCSNGKDSAQFTAVVETNIQYVGDAILVSELRPYYDSPFLNKVSYAITGDHTIDVESATFSLVIRPDGQGTYTRKGQMESPPSDPTSDSDSTAVKNTDSRAPYFLFQAIPLECRTPFTKGPVSPTGFSVGNSVLPGETMKSPQKFNPIKLPQVPRQK